jgi:hypothetical protein
MADRLDHETARAARADARGLETDADSAEPYPESTEVRQPNRGSRMFNMRLGEQEYAELKRLAETRHLPMSTMAKSWLLDRLDRERAAS